MEKIELFVYLFLMLLIIAVSCFFCNKHMSKNRGNFVNYPAWRKATKAAFDIILSLIAISLLVYYKLFFHLAISLTIPLLLVALIAIIYNIIKKTPSKKSNKNNLFNGVKIFADNKVLNIAVIEYVVYGIRYISKSISSWLVAFIGMYQIAKNIWEIENVAENLYLLRIISLIAKFISNDFSIYIMGISFFLIFYSSLFMMILSITLDGDNVSSSDQKRYFNIRRKFSFKEHSI